MSGKGLFICGTDTGVGKTYVSTLLISELCKAGLRVAAMKPVASGARIIHGELVNDDALQLMQATNVSCAYETVNPYCFAPAVAPHLAAQEIGTVIDIGIIEQNYRKLAVQADVVIVEGVGGWSVPINDTQTMAHVAATLQLPVLMVVGMRLGCLNHALLTAQAIRQSGSQLAGWFANILEPDMTMLEGNISSLKERLDALCIGTVAFDTTAIQLSQSAIQRLLSDS